MKRLTCVQISEFLVFLVSLHTDPKKLHMEGIYNTNIKQDICAQHK